MRINAEIAEGMFTLGELKALVEQIPEHVDRIDARVNQRKGLLESRQKALESIKQAVVFLKKHENEEKTLFTNKDLAALFEHWVGDLEDLCWAYTTINEMEEHTKNELLDSMDASEIIETIKDMMKEFDTLISGRGE